MDTFLFDPADCLILQALRDTKSLRDAAVRLHCDPAGLSRKITRIAAETTYVQKVGGRWTVTGRGLEMIAWAEEAVLSQRRLLKSTETLRIASSAWLQEQVLIPKFAQLEKSIGPDIKVEFHVPTASLEERLLESLSDFAVACHPPESPEIAFRRLQKEKWIIVAPSRWKSSSLKNVERLIQLPFIRHLDSHQEIFLPWVKTPLEARLSMNSLNSVRAAVKKGLGWSVMPKLAALKDLEDGSLLELPIEVNVDDRFVCLWWLRNRSSVKSHASVLSRWICEA